MKLKNWILEIFEIDISFYHITLDNRQKQVHTTFDNFLNMQKSLEVILCFLLMYIGLRMYINWACTISSFVKTPLKALIWLFLSYILCKTKVKRNLVLTVYIKSSLLQHYSIINDNQNVLLCKMLILPLYFQKWYFLI